MRPRKRPNTLRQAASAVFAVTAVVPLLIFVWTVYHLGALSRLDAQLGLALALAIALLGYYIFRRLMGQMSDLISALGKAVELGVRSGARANAVTSGAPVQPDASQAATAPPAPASRRLAAEPASPGATAPLDVAGARNASATPAPPPASRLTSTPPAALASHRAGEEPTVPGLGAIREVHDLSRAMVLLWQAEAVVYVGRRVAVSVMNSPQPIIGTLIELTDDELLIQTEGSEQLAVSYSRVSAIDATESPAADARSDAL